MTTFSTVVSIAITNVLNCVPSLFCMAARAAACHSLNVVCQKYEICKYSIASEGRGVFIRKFNNIHAGASDDNLHKSSAIKGVISLREYGDSTAEIDNILEYLCVR